MITKLTGWILIFAVLAANYSSLFVVAGFKINQKYIAENLCVNRAKPWLHCNGQCYFMKKMKQVEENEKNDERQTQKNLVQETFFEPAATVKFHTYLLQVINTPYQFQVPHRPDNAIFRPPQFS